MKKNRTRSGKWMLVWMTLLMAVTAPAQINTDRVLSIGRNALYFEDYVLSIQYFNQVINAKPYLYEPYFFRGLAKLNLEDYSGTERDCTESLERNPYFIASYQVRGLARIRQDNLEGALDDYQHALQYDPENLNVRHNMAVCHIQLHKYDDALEDLNQLISISPHYTPAYLIRSEVYMKQKDTLRAEADINHALQIDFYDPDVWAARAMLRLQKQEYADAEADLDQSIHLSARNAGLYINRALARYYRNNLRGAMADYDIALDMERNNFIGHYNRGLLRAQVGDYAHALEDFNAVIEQEPDNMLAIFNRALLSDETGDLQSAVRDYTTVLEQYPNFMAGYQYRARANRRLGNIRQAESDEVTLLKAQIDAHNAGGNKNRNDKAETEEDAERTRKKSDRNVNNYRKIVVADEEDLGKYTSAYRGKVQDRNIHITPQPMFTLHYYEKANNELNAPLHYHAFIDGLNQSKAYPQRIMITNQEMALSEEQIAFHFRSIDEQTTRIVEQPNNVHPRYARAMDFYLVQDFSNAIDDLTEAIRIAPDFFPAYFLRAVIRFRQLEYAQREQIYDRATMPQRRGLEPRAIDYELIKRDLDKVIELAPDFVYAYYNRGNVLTALRDYHAAIVDYDKAIQLDPHLPDAYYNRGLTYVFLGNNQQGIRDLSQAGELGLYAAYNIIKRFTVQKAK